MSTAPPVSGTPEPIEVGSFFLETLTTGMYENPFHCIREYVQNGYDAIEDAIRVGLLGADDGRILISIGGTQRAPSLTIRDNGIGIPAAKAYSTLVSLGASRKTPALHAGFRGIGRLAGIAYCTTLRFTTSAGGEPVATVVEYDCGHVRSFFSPGAEPIDVREVVRSSVKTRTIEANAAEHFTQVEMLHLVNLGTEFVDLTMLQPYLRQVCPVDYPDKFDFADQVRSLAEGFGEPIGAIHVETRQKRENTPILKPYTNVYPTGPRVAPSKIHSLQTFSSREHGWFAWIGVSNFPGEIVDETVAGVRFRIKNIQVGDAEIITDLAEELTAGGSERRLMRWAVGEIFLTNPKVVPNARRDGFEDSPEWRAVRRDIKEQVVKQITKLVRSASTTRSAMKAITDALKEVTEQAQVPDLTAIAKANIEAAIKRNLNSLASRDRLLVADPKEVSELTAKFKELQEKLAKREIKEPEPQPEPGDDQDDADADNSGGNDADDADGGDATAPTRADVIFSALCTELEEVQARKLAELIVQKLYEAGL